MNVRVLMFGALSERVDRSVVVQVGAPATAGALVSAVAATYPNVVGLLERCAVAVNHEVVEPGHVLTEDDEVALMPPMSGGAGISVELTPQPSVDEAIAAAAAPGAGGTAVFVGTVRDSSDAGPVSALEYSAYDEMAINVIGDIADEASEKWGLLGVAVRHAIGPRTIGAITFVVVCAAAHRDEAFDACRYVVDEVKRRAPVWKKESGPWGERWVNL